MRIAYVGGYWATNIGNAYYNLGVLHLLRTIAGDDNVYFVPDLTAWAWRTPNAYDVVEDVDVDLWVLSGPGFSDGISGYRRLFDRVRERGSQVAFVSVGCWAYTDAEWAQVNAFLAPYRDQIRFVSTRDRHTYQRAVNLGCPVYDGICGSMFLPDAVNIPLLDRPPYVVLNFGPREEPKLAVVDGEFVVQLQPLDTGGGRLARGRASRRRSKRAWPSRVDEYDIVRTQSAAHSRVAAKLFDRPITHYSDLPHGPLTLYKSAAAVFSDRVHTCAATLAFGGTARYVFASNRSRDGRFALLDRVGASAVFEQLTKLDTEFVDEEKGAMTQALRGLL